MPAVFAGDTLWPDWAPPNLQNQAPWIDYGRCENWKKPRNRPTLPPLTLPIRMAPRFVGLTGKRVADPCESPEPMSSSLMERWPRGFPGAIVSLSRSLIRYPNGIRKSWRTRSLACWLLRSQRDAAARFLLKRWMGSRSPKQEWPLPSSKPAFPAARGDT